MVPLPVEIVCVAFVFGFVFVVLPRMVCDSVADVAVSVADHKNYCSRPSSHQFRKDICKTHFN